MSPPNQPTTTTTTLAGSVKSGEEKHGKTGTVHTRASETETGQKRTGKSPARLAQTVRSPVVVRRTSREEGVCV